MPSTPEISLRRSETSIRATSATSQTRIIGQRVLSTLYKSSVVAKKIAAVCHANPGFGRWRLLSGLSRRWMIGCRTGHPDPQETSCWCATVACFQEFYSGQIDSGAHNSPESAACVLLFSFTSETVFDLIGNQG